MSDEERDDEQWQAAFRNPPLARQHKGLMWNVEEPRRAEPTPAEAAGVDGKVRLGAAGVRKDDYEEVEHPRGPGGRWREKPLSPEDRAIVDGLLAKSREGVDAVEGLTDSVSVDPAEWSDLTPEQQARAAEVWKKSEFDSELEVAVGNWRYDKFQDRFAELEGKLALRDPDAVADMRERAAVALKRNFDNWASVGEPLRELTIEDARRAVAGWSGAVGNFGTLPGAIDWEFLSTFGGPDKTTDISAMPSLTGAQIQVAAASQLRDDIARAIEPTDADLDAMATKVRFGLDEQWDGMNDDVRLASFKKLAISYPELRGAGTSVRRWLSQPDSLSEDDLLGARATQRTTQALRRLVGARANQLDPDLPATVAERLSDDMWGRWKRDSQDPGGQTMQWVAARTLGARSRLSPADAKASVDQYVDEIAGTGAMRPANASADSARTAIEAVVRAQYDVTQWALKRAGVDEVNVYRGLMLDSRDVVAGLSAEPKRIADMVVESRTKSEPAVDLRYLAHSVMRSMPSLPLPELSLKQAALQSTTMSLDVANDWGGIGDNMPVHPTRVVLRATVPRQAVYSVPAFGENEHEERELIAVGAPWRAWDAFAHKAPPPAAVPIGSPKRVDVSGLRSLLNEG